VIEAIVDERGAVVRWRGGCSAVEMCRIAIHS
jgi:hypothetical protein